MPNATVGIREPQSLATPVAPAAITPSTEPLPNSCGFFDTDFAWP